MARYYGIGLDLGRRIVVAATAEGEVAQFQRPQDLQRCAMWIRSRSSWGELRIALEASSETLDLIQEPAFGSLHASMRVIQPQRVVQVRSGYGWSKSDRNDATVLADLASRGCGTRPEELAVIEARQLVRARERLLRRRRELRELERVMRPENDTMNWLFIVEDALEDALEQLTAQVITTIQRRAQREFDLLVAIQGFGPTTVATILGELGEISRFPTPRKLVGATGLHPRSRASGEQTSPALGARCRGGGNRHLRRAFLAAVSCMRLHHPEFVQLDKQLRERGKAPMVVRVALARRIAILVHKTLTSEGHEVAKQPDQA